MARMNIIGYVLLSILFLFLVFTFWQNGYFGIDLVSIGFFIISGLLISWTDMGKNPAYKVLLSFSWIVYWLFVSVTCLSVAKFFVETMPGKFENLVALFTFGGLFFILFMATNVLHCIILVFSSMKKSISGGKEADSTDGMQ